MTCCLRPSASAPRLRRMSSSKKKKIYNIQTVVRSALRRAWLWSPMRTEAKKKARIERNSYRCAKCKETFPSREIAIDHVTPVTPVAGFDSWDGFISRLFCPPSKLAVMCKPCHKIKTKSENDLRKTKKKLVTGPK